MNTRLAVHSIILMVMLAYSACAKDAVVLLGCATNPPDLADLTYEAANDAVNSEVESIGAMRTKRICQEYVTNLLNQLRLGQLDNDKKVLAIFLLGCLHPSDTNSIEYLIENIAFKAEKLDPKTRLPRWSEYPARDALTKIGKPVIEPILRHLAAGQNSLRRSLMCDVLHSGWVLGNAAAVEQLNRRITTELDLVRRENLELALKEFK